MDINDLFDGIMKNVNQFADEGMPADCTQRCLAHVRAAHCVLSARVREHFLIGAGRSGGRL